MSIDTAPCEESAWKRRPLAEMSDATLVNFFQHPDRPVLYADIASAVPGYGSYRSIKNAVDDGLAIFPAAQMLKMSRIGLKAPEI